jgi:hypothetical protein
MNAQSVFRMLHAFARWLLALCWTGATLLATVVLFFGNFVVAWQAFVLLGFEQEPLLNVPLIGPLAMAIGVGDAQLAALYAAVLTAAMGVTVVGSFKLGNEALTLFFDLRQARLAEQDTAGGKVKLAEATVAFAVLAAIAIVVARYDVSLFNVRLQALLTGQEIEDALKWLPDEVTRLGGFLSTFAAHARWGYIAVIAGVAFVTEKSFQRASERWLVWAQTIDALIDGPAATAPIATPAVDAPTVDGVEARAPATAGPSADPVAEGAAENPERAPNASSPVPPPPRPADPMSTPPPPPPGPTVRVVWGPAEIRHMSLAEVERNQNDYVRDGSGRIWFLRTYYEQVKSATSEAQSHSQSTEQEQESAHA